MNNRGVFKKRNKSQFGGVNSPSDRIPRFLSGMPENLVVSVIRPRYRYSRPVAAIKGLQLAARYSGGESTCKPTARNAKSYVFVFAVGVNK